MDYSLYADFSLNVLVECMGFGTMNRRSTIKLYMDIQPHKVSVPNPHIIQGSTVFLLTLQVSFFRVSLVLLRVFEKNWKENEY